MSNKIELDVPPQSGAAWQRLATVHVGQLTWDALLKRYVLRASDANLTGGIHEVIEARAKGGKSRRYEFVRKGGVAGIHHPVGSTKNSRVRSRSGRRFEFVPLGGASLIYLDAAGRELAVIL